MPRFMFVALASVAFLGLLMPVVFLILSQKVTVVVEVNFGHSLKEQIKTVQDRSMELSIQLKELKNSWLIKLPVFMKTDGFFVMLIKN